MRLGTRKLEQVLPNNDSRYEPVRQGKLLRLNITNGYYQHILLRKNLATQSQIKLYRFQDVQTKIKLHFIKALIIPVLDYPLIPAHAMSNA